MESGQFVLRFDEVREGDRHLVGGKGLRLAEMAQAGLPVLPGFCVTTTAYRAFLRHNGLETAVSAGDEAAVRSHMAVAELPPAVAEAILEAYQALSEPVAVRSSATAEDSHDASFAGQYDTFLNVTGGQAVLEKVRACWAGLWSERALAYMREQGLDPFQADMGVVVQRQGRALAAGVLFTLNPMTGREEEMVVEAVWGLGEAIVSGRVTPDHYVIDALNRQVLSHNIANQAVVLVADEQGGVREEPLPAGQHDRPVLSDEQLLELVDLGYQVQAIYGYPQDIEWALVDEDDVPQVHGFVLLQTRPLTSFSFDPDLGQWTSGNYREVLPGFASPLAMSLSLEHDYGRALSEFFRDIKMGEAPPGTVWGRPFFGRAYWNVGVTKQFAALVPGFKERVFDQTVGIEPTYEGDGQVTPWSPQTILRALPILFALNEQYKNCWREGRAYRDRFLNEIEPALTAVDPVSLSHEALGDYCRQMAELHWEANGTAIRVSMLSTQAQDDFEPMVRRLNATLPRDQRIAEGDLITGLSDVRTAQPTLELWELARDALNDPQVAAAVTQGDPDGIPQRLQASEPGRLFWEKVKAYLDRYRYMAPIDEDLSEPRWDEDPSFVLSTLQAYALADESMDPNRRLEAQRQVRRRTERRVLEILSRSWRRLWPFARRSFIKQLRLVRRYVWWREETRVIASRAFYQCRRFYKELGRRWASQGILDEQDHIFLLRWPAIRAVLDWEAPAESLREKVRNYLRLKTCYRNFEPPSVIGVGASMRKLNLRPGQRVFEGIPCSSGQVEGIARVVENLEEARALQRGEILVARYTNPGWTPLFNLAGGIVIEEGGLLSHGAVVAREYGIPAVLRIEGATRIFHTGQRLRIDGSIGTVEIL
ncbi:MAG: PEP/pyruvate-binding domain-containing protein [Anaerolineae bacterium]